MGDKSILELLCSKDYEIALMTTFNFEIDFFERVVLSRLADNNIRKISLFIDAKELTKSLMQVNSSYIGRRYNVTPINMNASFHPKVFLLLGKKKARLIVGSANLTRSGLLSNSEIYNVFDYNDQTPENLSLIIAAMDMFKKLHLINETDNNLFEEINYIGYLGREVSNSESQLLNSLEESIFNQIKDSIKADVVSIDIAVPYYDNDLKALNNIKNEYSQAKITLYIQNRLSTFNVEKNNKENVMPLEDIKTFEECKCNNSNNFYHGKVIRFTTNQESYILYGSANCTLSALFDSYKQGGNVECDIFEKGSLNEFDYFFENFKIVKVEKIENQIIDYSGNDSQVFTFNYLENDITYKVHINYSTKKEITSVKINEEDVKYNYEDELLVFVPLEVLNDLDILFGIDIYYDSKIETIKCWHNNEQSIASFREVSSEKSVTTIKIDNFESLMMDDAMLIINKMADPDEYNSLKKYVTTKKSENENPDEESEEFDYFAIDDFVQDEYIRRYKEYEYVNSCIKRLANNYFSGIRRKHNDGGYKPSFIKEPSIPSDDDLDNLNNEQKTIRKATEPEKRFERFVKNKIEDLLSPEKIEKKSYDEYKDLIGFFFGIFDKYKYQEKIEDIFLDKYVIEIKHLLLDALLSKEEAHNDKNKEDNIIMTLMVIIETDYINSLQESLNYKVEFKNKELLKKLENVYSIRESFTNYLKQSIDFINERTIKIIKEIKSRNDDDNPISEKDVYLIRDIISVDHATNVIQRLYGYKTNTELLTIIKKYYGDNSSISFDGDTINIECDAEEAGKHLSVENNDALIRMLKDIRNYSKNVSEIKELKAIINISSSSGLIKIEYLINFNKQSYEALLYYSDGKIIPRNKQIRV